MLKATLQRISSSCSHTTGKLSFNGFQCHTLELPWRNNRRNTSCIPCGTYICRRIKSPKFGETFEICNVPGRSGILFHKGNTTKDSRGCVLLGLYMDGAATQNGYLAASGLEFSVFMDKLQGVNEFQLSITDEEDKK